MRSRGFKVVGARGFEPPTFRSRNGGGDRGERAVPSARSSPIAEGGEVGPADVQSVDRGSGVAGVAGPAAGPAVAAVRAHANDEATPSATATQEITSEHRRRIFPIDLARAQPAKHGHDRER